MEVFEKTKEAKPVKQIMARGYERLRQGEDNAGNATEGVEPQSRVQSDGVTSRGHLQPQSRMIGNSHSWWLSSFACHLVAHTGGERAQEA